MSEEPAPPRLFRLLVRLLAPAAHRDFLLGDLEEGYRRRVEDEPKAARRWYRRQALGALRHRGDRRPRAAPGRPGGVLGRTRRGVLGARGLDGLLFDLRYALRALGAAPKLTAVVVVSLGLAVGATSAIFSVVDALLLETLPVADPHRLVQVTTDASTTDLFTYPLWEGLRDVEDVFDGSFAIGETVFEVDASVGGDGVLGAYVSGGFFGTLGIAPQLGRLLAPADDHRGCAAVAVLGQGFWRRRRGADPAVVGDTISLDGHPFEVVGVAPEGFRGVTGGVAQEIFVPLCAVAAVRGSHSILEARSAWWFRVMGRLAEDVTMEEARVRLAALAPHVLERTVPEVWQGERRDDYLDSTFHLESAATGISRVRDPYREPLSVLAAFAGIVMMVACANVATLLLARSATRQREIAVRVAMGAGRGRLARQVLAEAAVLAAAGCLVGLLLASQGSRALVLLMSTRDTSLALDLSLDGRILLFNTGLGVATALLFGLAPALRALRVPPWVAIGGGCREKVIAGIPRLATGRAFVAVQVALAVVLLTCAALLVTTLWRLYTLDPGFDRERVVLARIDVGPAGVPREAQQELFFDLLGRIRALPGVREASMSYLSPLSGSSWTNPLEVVDGPGTGRSVEVHLNLVSDGYFETLGTPRVAGRDFGSEDVPGAEPVAILNETAAERLFAGEAALGRRLAMELGDGRLGDPHRVVGIAGDAKYRSLRETPPPTVYLALRQDTTWYGTTLLALRAQGAPEALFPVLTDAVAELDPHIAVDLDTLAQQVSATLDGEQTLAVLALSFAALGLVLAVIGLYAIMSYSVVRRHHEIAVRLAVGADPGRVLALMLGDVGRLLLGGAALGVLLSLAVGRWIESFLYGIEPTSPSAMLLATAFVLLGGLVSGFLPVRRAIRVDPVRLLRRQ